MTSVNDNTGNEGLPPAEIERRIEVQRNIPLLFIVGIMLVLLAFAMVFSVDGRHHSPNLVSAPSQPAHPATPGEAPHNRT